MFADSRALVNIPISSPDVKSLPPPSDKQDDKEEKSMQIDINYSVDGTDTTTAKITTTYANYEENSHNYNQSYMFGNWKLGK